MQGPADGWPVAPGMVDLIQWPAMVVTLWASWCVASKSEGRRNYGFWLFLVSNAMWIVWGVGSRMGRSLQGW